MSIEFASTARQNADHAERQPEAIPWERVVIGDRIGTSQRLVLMPRNTVEHVEARHSLDAAILEDLQEFFDRWEYIDTDVTEPTRIVI